MEAIIQTEKLSHIYSAGTPFEHGALIDVDFTAYRGEYLGIIGHTGSGKSTLIQHLNGLLKPTSGRVLFEGKDIWETKERTHQTRFHVGLVFQYPEYQLFEETVYKDIAFGPRNMKLSEGEIDRRVREAAAFVGLSDAMLEQSPFELSGGQKRRVAIAGVIAMEPSVLILDEPTAGLDPVGVENILSNIHDYHVAKNATIIIVSHSMEEVARTVDRLVVVNDGRIPFAGTPREVFAHEEELIAMGLGVPQVTRVLHRLRKLGVDVDDTAYTMEQAKAAVMAAYRARKGAV
ncbi:energy-coupling factor transporter ATPase [uncultured Pseudoflavonifractor sp.]|uniref:energy-coupling factor transporter ATPase n=1 Tax=uncultured Pseudoflavonifractor sp. TaxID=1221379 RepID=UPI0025E4AD3D|nr:energy-coupling factor transporter ATPase [uncultured Pseudoflavonifractor sp.]